MKTRTATKLAEAAIKPVLTTSFKASKSRTLRRPNVSAKKAATSVELSIQRTEISQTEIEMLDASAESPSPTPPSDTGMNPIVADSLTDVKRQRPVRATRTTKASIVEVVQEVQGSTTTQVLAVQVTEKKKAAKHPEEDPWKKRAMITPDYATKAFEHLSTVDPALGKVMQSIPFEVYAEKDTNYFRVLTRTIVGQQVHWKAARSILLKFVCFYYPSTTFDSIDRGFYDFPTPQQVIVTSMADLRSCGLSERKASYIQDLAQHFADDRITFQKPGVLPTLTDKEIADQLLCVRGIGPWTVDMFLMFQLERLDILPTLDLGVRKGMELHFKSEFKNGVWGIPFEEEDTDGDDDEEMAEGGEGDVSLQKKADKKKKKKKVAFKGKGTKKGEMTIQDMERMAERWRPYRSIGAWYMWRVLDDKITASI
ncbi:hypothetical protein BGZ73_008320 [Actinomortierella ambigua]|nr:hypothetical protein BGZ73_008320 [Actinomortierella ambigua]